jgi:small-conductance mechanosensitive channel
MERGWLVGIVLIAALLLAAAGGVASEAPSPATLRFWNRDIVDFRAPVGAVDPQERAARSAARIAALGEDAKLDDVRIEPATVSGISGVIVYSGDHPLYGLVEQDLDPVDDLTLRQAAERSVERLRGAFAARSEQRYPKVIIIGILRSLGATAVLAAALLFLTWFGRRVDARLERLRLDAMRSLGGLDLRRTARHASHSLLSLVLWIARLIAVYLWVVEVLGDFAYTQPWAEALGSAMLRLLGDLGRGAIRALPGLFLVAVILYGARLATRGLSAFFTGIEAGMVVVPWLHPETARASRRIAIAAVWFFALAIAYPHLPDSDRPAFQAVSVIAGVAVTLGSRGLVNEAMSGLAIVYARAMRVGDVVRIGELLGVVTELGLLATKIRTFEREEVTVPNGTLVAERVTNYSRLPVPEGGMIVATVSIGYDAPWRQVHAMLLLAAQRTSRVRRDPTPEVLQRALTDPSVQYELRCRIDDQRERLEALSDLHAHIQDVFIEHGVQIMTPHFEEQPREAVLVPRERWYAPPAASEA